MNRDEKRQILAILLLLVFVGSAIAYAFLLLPASPTTTTTNTNLQYDYDRPLSESEEASYVQRGAVIIKYFYSADCIDCDTLNTHITQLSQALPGKVVVERLDLAKYNLLATGLNVTEAPAMILLGYGKRERIDGYTEYNDLFVKTCTLYPYTVNECSI